MACRHFHHRDKIFGQACGVPLDRNAKVRIIVFARARNARLKQKGQHWGPLTRATLQVLEALLWGFHNAKSGRCFPSYETIAAKAGCCRDTVHRAIKALEAAGILTWVNRLVRIELRERSLFGAIVVRQRVIRTSNAYTFRDPLSGQAGARPSKSQNPTETQNQDLSRKGETPNIIVLDPKSPLDEALIRLGRTGGWLAEGG